MNLGLLSTNDLAEWTARALFLWSLAASLLLFAAMAISFLLRQHPAASQHKVWLCAALSVFLLPALWCLIPGIVPNELAFHSGSSLQATKPLPTKPLASASNATRVSTQETVRETPLHSPQRAFPEGQGPLITTDRPIQVSGPAEEIKFQTTEFPWTSLATTAVLIWFFGMAAKAVQYQFLRRSLARETGSMAVITNSSLVSLAARLGAEAGLNVHAKQLGLPSRGRWEGRRKAVEVTISRSDLGPLVYGSFPAQLLLPCSLNSLSVEAQEAAIWHELAHIIRGDEWTRRLLVVLGTIFWFHPLIWYCCSRIQLTAERACDEFAIRKGCRRSVYAELLVQMARSKRLVYSAIGTSGMAQSQIVSRVESIVNFDRLRARLSSLAETGLMIAVLSVAVVVAALRPSINTVKATGTTPLAVIPQGGDRVLHFPKDRVVGSIAIGKYEGISQTFGSFKEIGKATGDVRMPAGQDVRLWVSADGARDMSFLDALPSDALCELNLWRSRAEDSQIPHIAKLTGLKVLVLEDTRITPRAIEKLSTLTKLIHFHYDAIMSNRESRKKNAQADPFGADPFAADVAVASPTDRPYGVDDEAVKVFRSMPELKYLGLRWNPITSKALRTIAQLKKLEHIALDETFVSDEHLEYLALLTNLRSISFQPYAKGSELTDLGAQRLARIKSLEHIRLPGAKLTKVGLAALATLPKLEYLSFDGAPIPPADFAELRVSKTLKEVRSDWRAKDWQEYASAFAQIQSLEVLGYSFPVDRVGLTKILSLPKLRSLNISGRREDVEFEGIGEELAKSTKLEELSIYGISLAESGLEWVKTLPSLKELSVNEIEIRGPELSALADLPKLELLYIGANRVGKIDVSYLPELPNLKRLGLSFVDIPADVMWFQKFRSLEGANFQSLVRDRHLPGIAQWTKLEQLDLGDAALSDAGIAKLKTLKQVNYLQLAGGLTVDGLSVLRELPKLQSLWITSPYFGEQQKPALEKVLGSVSVNVQGGGDTCVYPDPKDGILRFGSGPEMRDFYSKLEGKPAPAFRTTQWFNAPNDSSIQSLRGQVILLDFRQAFDFGDGLGRMEWIEMMQKLQSKFADRGLVVISIQPPSVATPLPEHLKANPVSFKIGIDDGELTTKAYGDSTCLIDRSGVLRIANIYPDDLEEAIQKLLQEK